MKRVLIVKSTHSGFWYTENVGREYLINDIPHNPLLYNIVGLVDGHDRCILKTDCEVIPVGIKPIKHLKEKVGL